MAYKSIDDVVKDLEKTGQLVRIREEVDPNLVMAEIQRQAYARKLGAIFFERVKGSRFPAVSNLFGTVERTNFIFRRTLKNVSAVVSLKSDPLLALHPLRLLRAAAAALHALPLPSLKRAAVQWGECKLEDLPQIKSWPDDGGAFITLPQVFSLDPKKPSLLKSNLGMYRIQLSGGDYIPNEEIGLHYQIHRGLGAHHANAIAANKPLPVAVWVGGPPAHTFAAVMPLPEGLSELTFAGMFAGRNFRYKKQDGFVISSDADFCILGEIALDQLKPEGPFGDHLGYYSLRHDFPFLRVKKVYHRRNAVWPFTVVGRPPQEDTSFGHLIHEVTASLVPKEIPGVKALQAVDEAGVHPLLLAVGKERYVPYAERRPMELNTIANRILGFGQCSLAKYLFLVAEEDDPQLDVNNTPAFFRHLLERFDPENDLHFQTRTTMDTLDYSGEGINKGSKLVIVACGKKKRTLGRSLPQCSLPPDFGAVKFIAEGILAVSGPQWRSEMQATDLSDAKRLAAAFQNTQGFPLVVLCDDAEFVSASFDNFLWATFTRSNPSHDVHGIGEFTTNKHFGATVGIVIDARIKPHHAPALAVDPSIRSLASEILERALRQNR
ncbi:MAG: hypothetical protein RIR26_1918 [Pseudomonadota bacterium]